MNVVEIAPADTYDLRRRALRDGTRSDEVVFEGDHEATTFHLGVRDGDRLIAISTWMQRRHPDLPALAGYQLRGMASDPARRGGGVGSLLLDAGTRRCADLGGVVIWARARMTAVAFYRRHGFETRGPEYTDLTTGLAHVDIVRLL